MIHDVQGVTDLLDRYFGAVGRRPLSLLRIFCWMLVGLAGIGLVWQAPGVSLADSQYNAKMKNRTVRDVTLDKNDVRGFAHRDHGPNSFTIAWIGASTLQSIGPGRYTFLPDDVRTLLPKIDGKRVYVDMYFMSGARTIDLYNATQAAVAAKPDMIVVSLNPVWLFNDSAIQSWDNLDSVSFVNSVDDPRSWPLLAAMTSPSDAVLGLAGKGFPAIRDRWSYANVLRARIDRLSPLDRSAAPAPEENPSELGSIAAMGAPIEFWSKYRPKAGAGADLASQQLAFLQGGDPTDATVNDLVVDRMVANLAASGIPTFAYIDAIDPEALEDPRIDAQLTRIENHLKAIADRYPAADLTVHWQSVGRDVGPMPFKDLVHMEDDRPLAVYLAAQLCDQLVETGAAASCEPTKKELP